jgi:DNA polymerase-1
MAERMAVNAPIQGTATADIIKMGMKRVDEELIKAGMKKYTRLILQIHDELIYEIKEEKVNEINPIIEEALKNVIPDEFLKNITPVPLSVSCDIGSNWGELK